MCRFRHGPAPACSGYAVRTSTRPVGVVGSVVAVGVLLDMEPFGRGRGLVAVEDNIRSTPDEDLWLKALDGDGHALAVVFDRHADRVLTHCARRLGTRQDADIVASEVFVQAWKSGRGVKFVDGSVLPWLLVVANNVARRHDRSRRRYEALQKRIAVDSELSDDPAEEALNRIELRRRTAELARAIAQLPTRHQEVVGLCDLGELSYADAAAILSVPIGTIRSRLSRAHNKLRDFLDEDSADRPGRGTRPSTIEVKP